MKNGSALLLITAILCCLLFSACGKTSDSAALAPAAASSLAYEYQNKAEAFLEQHLNDSAYYYFLQSNRELLRLRDFENLTYNAIQISEIQLYLGDVLGAEETCTEALKYAPADQPTYLIAIYNNIGRCYRKLYNYDSAIDYYEKALKLETDPLHQLIIKNNTAYTYLKNNRPKQAIALLDSLVQIPLLQQHPLQYARTLDNLGISQFEADNTTGLEALKRALNIRDSLRYEHGLIESYANLSQYYSDKDRSLANAYALQMYRLAQKLKNPDDELSALALLLKSSETPSLRNWSEKYIERANTINQTHQTAKNQFAKIKYDHQKETAENQELKAKTTQQELDIARETSRKQFLLFVLLTLVAGVFWFVKSSRRRHSIEKAKQVYLTETNISKKIHDELANDIYNMVAYSENFDLATETHKNRLLNDLEKAYNKTRNISSEYAAVRFGDDFSSYLKGLLQEYHGRDTKIVSVGLDAKAWNSLSEIKKIAVYRVVQELLINMKKHSKATLVSFHFERVKGRLKISYSDNGTGIVNEKLIAKNGLTNAETRIKDIGGSFIFETEINKGLKIFITIPT
ncbi:tetratricopeptide repeat protein [Flavobacterium sp. JP2137]|uniref:ATP-binding protein n=1 Tax=Flavobacterium sp. JP2137 TaxID=3414510 RepID=UPI003D3009AC